MVAGALSLSLLMALNYRLIFHPVHDGWQVPFSEHTMVTAPHELKLTKQTIFDLSFSMAAGGAVAMPPGWTIINNN